jgi:thiamine pyrophosphate-dependent acetolactate synthase large subunit-like protein
MRTFDAGTPVVTVATTDRRLCIDQETTMSAVVSSRNSAAGSTTAEDTLKQKTHDAGVVSRGHPAAKALNVGKLLSDVPFSKFAEMRGGHGEEMRDPARIAGALQRAREAMLRTGRSAIANIWVDPREYAPGTKNQTMYK